MDKYRIKGIKVIICAPLICIVVLFIFNKNANAQTGVKTGSTASSFYYTDINPNPYQDFYIDLRPFLGYDIELAQTNDQKPLLSPCLSVFYKFNLAKRLGVRPELMFTQKGVNFSQFEYERVIYKARICYIELPLSLAYQVVQKERSASEFYFGAYAAYKINAVKKVAAHNSPIKKTELSSVKNFDGGIHLGVNYKQKYFDKFFLIDLRVFIGLSNIFEIPEDWTSIYYTTQETKITGINLSVGYEF